MLIGREEERKILLDALNTGHSELIAIYGRRRIGKTFLIREVYAGKVDFEFAGMHRGTLRQQLKNFHQAFPTKYRKGTSPADWLDAFQLLGRYIDGLRGKGKKVLFIDEFP